MTGTEKEKASSSVSQSTCFKPGHEEFGVDILKVKEITPLKNIAHLSRNSKTMSKIINLRGGLVPVINLRENSALRTFRAMTKPASSCLSYWENSSA